MTKTLVVVDMQPIFEASRQVNVLSGVAKQIVEAMQMGWNIILLEYRGSGKTNQWLRNLLKGYRQKARVAKVDDDGSKQVYKTVKRRNFTSEAFRVCGVNATSCVWATVEGLLGLTAATVEVAKEACGDDKQFAWDNYLSHPRLVLV